jgi:hypothetical protein
VSEEGLRALEKELRGRAPASVASLDDQALRDLGEAIRAARHAQAAELAAAGDRALAFIPRLLRGPIMRVLR